MLRIRLMTALALITALSFLVVDALTAQDQPGRNPRVANKKDGRNQPTGKAAPKEDPALAQYGIYARTAPRAAATEPVETTLPLAFQPGDRIVLVGNTLLDRSQHFGYLETLLHQQYPGHKLVVRNLAWSGDTPDLQPRPANFADLDQHLTHEKADVIIAAFGFNESFEGVEGLPAFRKSLSDWVAKMKAKAFNGKTGPRIVLLSPIANEDVEGVAAGDLNNANLKVYSEAIRVIAAEQKVGFVDLFTPTRAAMADSTNDLTINGVHLNARGYELYARAMHKALTGKDASRVDEKVRDAVLDKNRQYMRRYRPVNTYYYTGNRNKNYGYLDFLPAMRNFDVMVANRDARAWALAQGKAVPDKIDDSNVPPMPQTKQSRGANRWMSAADEYKSFKIDPRFEVTLFAGEEEFPDIAAPIQMRWDSKGRLWVSCSTTYPHVYPGFEPNDKLVILEDTDGDGKADKSTVFADDLHMPLSFEFGDGGVYVSEMPDLTFLQDTDGDGKADLRRRVLTGFGTEDSHHALHDITWTPDGDLIFRESVFHHSQVETPYGPVRQRNSGWFRYQPRDHRLTSFGTYSSTNPWGVTFDDWGQHVASHPIYAAAFHALDPPYPQQHARPAGLRAYSGVCGHEFIDFPNWPKDLQGQFVKVRYKPTNRVELLKWTEQPFGFDEQYVSDIIFSSNLSFIPVDLRYGPDGAMYVCDWYNPIKGHAQYSLRDERRDRHSGRIWRILPKGAKPVTPPKFDGATVEQLLDIQKRPEYRYRYWAKRELRAMDADKVKAALDRWVGALSKNDPRYRHHQVEAIWTYRNIGKVNAALLREVLICEEPMARAAATQQLRYWHAHLPDAIDLLRRSANDPHAVVRMQAAIAASYIGTRAALDAALDVARHPRDKHLAYAFTCALNSHTLQRHWRDNPAYAHVPDLLKKSNVRSDLLEPPATASQAQFDSLKNLKTINISCVPERMRFTVERAVVKTGQPVKIVFSNPDATDHNLVLVKPGALEEVGMAANDMARDPANANSDFIPGSKKHLIIEATPMIGPTRKARVHVMRFVAPKKPGVYPYVCTFPGHWVVMTGQLVVVDKLDDVDRVLATVKRPAFVKNWTVDDLAKDAANTQGRNIMRGYKAFMTAKCNQCHQINGHGVALGPDLTKVAEKYKGVALLRQVIEPSTEVDPKYQPVRVVKKNGDVVFGSIVKETRQAVHVVPNLLAPNEVKVVPKRQIAKRIPAKLSPMPTGLVSMLTKDEILDLLAFLEAGGYKLPDGLKHKHQHE